MSGARGAEMPVALARIDQKLIHGQITAAWVPYLHIQEIVVIDDLVSEDHMTQAILTSGVPHPVRAAFVAEDAAAGFLAAPPIPPGADPRRLLLFGSVSSVHRAMEAGLVLESLNLGNMAYLPDAHRVKLSDSFYANARDLDILAGLLESGLSLFLQSLPADRPRPFVPPPAPCGGIRRSS
jgi:PTS system mannose-specific IIB component